MQIQADDAKSTYGIETAHEIMANGERRFRLRAADGSAYIRTEAADHGSWQNSHFHTHVRETYVVQKGWMGFADLKDGKLRIRRFSEGEVLTTEPYISHNVYLPSKSVIHTIKHGSGELSDWTADESLDAQVKNLSENELEQLASSETA